MAKYLQRACPRCHGYLGIVVPKRKAKLHVQAINGRCLKCSYRIAWAAAYMNSFARCNGFRDFRWICDIHVVDRIGGVNQNDIRRARIAS
jgi:hypothetical protein